MQVLLPAPISDKNSSAILAGNSDIDAQKDNKGALDALTVVTLSSSSNTSIEPNEQPASPSTDYAPLFGEFVLELFSCAAYFVSSEFADLYVATVIAIGVTVLTMIWQQTQHQHIKLELWIELAALVVTGGLGFSFKVYFLSNWSPRFATF